MTALCALMLADRGELDVDAPVARYWPEFAANGKDGVAVRHLLSHTAGLSGWDEPITCERPLRLGEGDRAARRAGAVVGAGHGVRLPRRHPGLPASARSSAGSPAGRSARFFAEEIAGPLGADFHIGLPPEHDDRVANVIPPPPTPMPRTPTRRASPRGRFGTRCRTPSWSWTHAVAAGRDPRRQRPRQRPLGRPDPVRRCPTAARPTACGCSRRRRCEADLPRAVQRRRPRPRRCRCASASATASPTRSAARPDRGACFWGGWGGSIVVIDLDAAAHGRLRDEPHGRGRPATSAARRSRSPPTRPWRR